MYWIALARTCSTYNSFTSLSAHSFCYHTPLTILQSLRPSSQPLGQVAKMLKLGRVQEVVFALGLSSSTDPEMSSHGKSGHAYICTVQLNIFNECRTMFSCTMCYVHQPHSVSLTMDSALTSSYIVSVDAHTLILCTCTHVNVVNVYR